MSHYEYVDTSALQMMLTNNHEMYSIEMYSTAGNYRPNKASVN